MATVRCCGSRNMLRIKDRVDGASVAPATPSSARVAISISAVVERSEEHTSELQSQSNLVCRLLLEKKKDAAGGTPAHVTGEARTGRTAGAAAELRVGEPRNPPVRVSANQDGAARPTSVVPSSPCAPDQ